jgi:hypothetical protein
MKAERPRWSGPAAKPEARPAERRTPALIEDSAWLKTDAGGKTDSKWRWPVTLRFAILVSGAFWLIVGLSVWAYFNAG